MKFKSPQMADHIPQLHPDVLKVVTDLDDWLKIQNWPEVVITEALRSDTEQQRIYYPWAVSILDKFRSGAVLNKSELYWAKHLSGKSETELQQWARAKFTWHKVGCALDLRNSIYSTDQRKRIYRWLIAQCHPGSQWEVLMHDVGRGDHFHIGRRDYEFKTRFEKQGRS